MLKVVDLTDFPSAATCVNFFDSEGYGLNPRAFRPLAPLVGGMSLLRVGEKPFASVMVANAWINHVRETGVPAKNAIEAIALNGDHYPGLVALALEVAAMSLKPRTPPEMALSIEDYLDLAERLFVTDVGGLYTLMHLEWSAKRNPDRPSVTAPKTRSVWKAELGHDVLIHPADLLPCRNHRGYLEYCGTRASGSWAQMRFLLPSGEFIETTDLPTQHYVEA